MLSRKLETLRIPDWVPGAARRRIIDLRAQPWLDDKGGGLLARLATYDVMKTDVWKKLPPEPQHVEGNIIDWAFKAFTIFPRLRRPIPKTMSKMREWAKQIEKYPPLPEPRFVAFSALELRDRILPLKVDTDAYWSRFWEGNMSVTPDQVLTILDQLCLFYIRMDEENQARLASLPEVKRWNANAAQKFFTDYLSRRMNETYGQPLDSIVAALAEVAFDLPKGVEAETVRGRRRTAHRKN
jgi:hypothetical protein